LSVSISFDEASRSSLYFPCFSRFFFSLSVSLVSYSLSFVSTSLRLSASSFNLQEGTSSFAGGVSPFGSVFGSVHHAGGVSLAGAGVQVVSAPVPFGFKSSGMCRIMKK
jgi:hypothetical protein